MTAHAQRERLFELWGILYSAPLALAGLVWLIALTDPSLVLRQWPLLLMLCALLLLFKQLDFFFFIQTEPTHYAQFTSYFDAIITWSAVLIFGPTVLWMSVLGDVVNWIRAWRRAGSAGGQWDSVRNAATNLTLSTLAHLLSLTLYRRLGGVFPLPGLARDAIWPAFVAALAYLVLSLLAHVPLLIYTVRVTRRVRAFASSSWPRALVLGLIAVSGNTFLVQLEAILAAGLYTLNGLSIYFFFLSGLLAISWLANRLSRALERSNQRSRELARLEALGRALLEAPPDASTLPDVLREQVPGMFSRSRIEIRMGHSPLYPEQTILHHPEDALADPSTFGAAVWEWQRVHPEPRHFSPRERLPWGEHLAAHLGAVLVPILDVETADLIGGIYLSRRWDTSEIERLMPAAQSLAAQIASALHRAQVHENEQRIAVERALRQREMEQAIADERNRLARDLHDSVTQSLYSLTLLAEAGQRMLAANCGAPELVSNQARLGDIAQQALQEMRLLVYQLRPLALESEGLVGALEQRLETVERRAGVQARVSVQGKIELAADVEEELYRIAQEALNNALKHARASRVELTIRAGEGAVLLRVSDDGRGFDPESADDAGGLGLVSMRERATKIGACLEVRSAPGEGTTVTVRTIVGPDLSLRAR